MPGTSFATLLDRAAESRTLELNPLELGQSLARNVAIARRRHCRQDDEPKCDELLTLLLRASSSHIEHVLHDASAAIGLAHGETGVVGVPRCAPLAILGILMSSAVPSFLSAPLDVTKISSGVQLRMKGFPQGSTEELPGSRCFSAMSCSTVGQPSEPDTACQFCMAARIVRAQLSAE